MSLWDFSQTSVSFANPAYLFDGTVSAAAAGSVYEFLRRREQFERARRPRSTPVPVPVEIIDLRPAAGAWP